MFARGVHRHDVEAQIPLSDAILHRKRFGSTPHPRLLALIDGLFGRPGAAAAPRFHLDEHQRLAVDCDQIYFRSGRAEIPRDDPLAVALQILFGGALAAAAERQICSQPRNQGNRSRNQFARIRHLHLIISDALTDMNLAECYDLCVAKQRTPAI